ncbi:MAG: hypothetical protein Q9167_007297 [Letrouitia subvulpina]
MSTTPPPPPTPSKLSVHCHHININVGDSTILLLVDDSAAKDNSTTPAEWPVIYNAVLIDGGKTTGAPAIVSCINRIQSSYTFAPTKTVGRLQFDAVIITHWDVDHWGGIKQLLQDHISDYLKGRSDLQTMLKAATDSGTDGIKSLQGTVAGLQIPFFKYASAEPKVLFKTAPKQGKAPDPAPIAPATLLTTFYIPYIDTERADNYRLGPKTSDSKPKVSNSGSTWIPNHAQPYVVGKDNTFGMLGYYTYKVGTGKPVQKGFKFFDLCKLVANYDDYLGVEVFLNKALPSGITYDTIKNPGQLIKAHTLTSTMGPRLFIVAGDQVIMGDTPLATSATVAAPLPPPTPPAPKDPTDPPKNLVKLAGLPPHPVNRIVDDRSSALGRRYTGVRNSAESMNAPSIACLVMSSTTDAPAAIEKKAEGTSWRLWHFMAGDAFWDVEGGIAAWLQAAEASNPKSTFMKISHHGGAGSTSALLLNTLQPNVVITPAGDKQVHGHPRPEVLMYLHALSLKLTPRWMRVYGFYWPPWMVRKSDHWSCSNFNTLPSGLKGTVTDAQEVFIIQLMNLYSAASMVDSPLAEFWKSDATLPLPPQKEKGKKTPQDVLDQIKQYETDRVNSMAAALRPFFTLICGQNSTDMAASPDPIHSILAIMDGTKARLKEVRATGPAPHEWQIYETNPAPPPPPITVVTPPPPGPSQPPPDESRKGKRRLEESTQLDTPTHQAKAVKSEAGAEKQEDQQNLALVVDAPADMDVEGDHKPGLQVMDKKSEGGDDAIDEDEEMPGPQEEEKVEGLHAGFAMPHAAVASVAPPADAHATLLDPGKQISQIKLPIRAAAPTVKVASGLAAADPSNTNPPASPFYLCGSDFDPFTPDNTQALLAPGDFSNWIATLNNGYVALAGQWVQQSPKTGQGSSQSPTPSSPQPVPATIHPNDEWFQRIYYNGLGIQQVTFVGYIDVPNSVARVTTLKVDLKLQVSVSTAVSLTFSSDASKTVSMGTRTASTSPTLQDAIMPDYTLLALGLQSSSTQLTVGQVITYFGMNFFPAGSTGGLTLPGFDLINPLKATLDTGPGSRSSLAFKPDVMYSTWLRLRFQIQDPAFATTFQTNFSFLGQVTLSDTAIVGLSTARCQSGFVGRQIDTQCMLETQITLGGNFGSLSISAWIKFEYAKTSIVIEFNDSYTWNQIEGWLVSVVSTPDTGSVSLDPTALLPNDSNVTFSVRKVTLTLANPVTGPGFSLLGASIMFEVTVYNTIFSLTLDWPGPSISARLWNSIAPNMSTYALLPYIDPYDQYTPLGAPTGAVDFEDFCGSSVTPPPGNMKLSPTFYELGLTASYDSNKKLQYQFTGTLQSLPLTSSSSVPKLVLGDLDFAFAYTPASGYDVLLSTSVYLVPRDFPTNLASLLRISVEYVDNGPSNVWHVVGHAENLSFATIYNFFDTDASDAVMDVLSSLSISELEVIWDYSSGEADLFINGLLRLGPFELDLTYQYLHSPGQDQSAWTFSASMGTHTSGPATLRTLFEDLDVDQAVLDALDDVPFVADLTIPGATPTPGSRPPVSLSISKEPDKETIFWVQVAISTSEGTLSFTYVQLQAARSAAAAGAASTMPTGFKRIVRVMLDRLPSLPGVPIVGPIPQPVDAIDYIWVGDSTVDNTTKTAGLTLSDISLINSTMVVDNYIPYKNSQSALQRASPGNTNSAQTNPYVLLAGHHFIVQANGGVIIDHLFGRGAAPSPSPAALSRFAISDTATMTKASGKRTRAGRKSLAKNKGKPQAVRFAAAEFASTPTAVTTDSGSTKAPLSKSIGPLTIHNVGLQTKDGYLYILIDATVALGPIQLSVVGFGVGLPLSRFNLNTLKTLTASDFNIALSGMSVYFNSPPVLISGVFIIDSTPTYEAYKGGLSVSIDPYSILAVGEYQHTYSTELKSVFIFGRFDGPLLTLEFAEISGVEVGFGYNYSLRTPQASDVLSFPLVQGVTAQPNPMDTLTSFSKYVSVEQDSVWLAFGFKMDAIQVLSLNAAAVVQFSATDVKVAIVGIASASMPPHVKSRNCHLVGGFALCYWFGDSPYNGDWVFTVGGYHPAYKPPSYYPVVPRVGINWNLSDVLTVQGSAFFAITPQVCMGGGQLKATFNAGPIYATFQAWGSFLINFKPFFFDAEIGVAVTCGFQCDIGIIHINIHADISASLHLSGPPFGGVVHVDLQIHNFSIYFGDQNNKPAALPWQDFLELVRQTRPDAALALAKNSSALIVATLVAGAATEKITSSQQQTGGMWSVRAGGVSFRIECKFPIDDMSWGDGSVQQSWKKSAPDATETPPIYARPMQLTTPCTSLLTVSIVPPDSGHEKPWAVNPYTKNLPDALWTEYDETQDPISSSSAGNSIGTLLNPPDSSGTSTNHLVGFTFTAPSPTLPVFSLPEFNAAEAMSEGVFQDGSNNPTGRNSPLLPPNPGNEDERPHLPQTPAEQVGDFPAPQSPDPWTQVETEWTNAPVKTANDLVTVWTGLLGWDATPPAGTTAPDQTTPFVPLVAAAPSMLLADFENWYQSCPLVTQVS